MGFMQPIVIAGHGLGKLFQHGIQSRVRAFPNPCADLSATESHVYGLIA